MWKERPISAFHVDRADIKYSFVLTEVACNSYKYIWNGNMKIIAFLFITDELLLATDSPLYC